jgi:hypothetical protein
MSYTKLDIKELQNRLDAIAISEDADGKDILVNKDIKLAGDSRYGKGKNPESVFVTKVEILPRGDEDGVAMADVFVEHDGPMEIYTDSGFEAEISKIVGFNVDFTESGMQQPGRASLEGLSQVSEYSMTTRDERDFDQEDEAELAELKSALGRTGGVMGFKN